MTVPSRWLKHSFLLLGGAGDALPTCVQTPNSATATLLLTEGGEVTSTDLHIMAMGDLIVMGGVIGEQATLRH